MNTCFVCGNKYTDCFELTMADKTYVFDCFECAIHRLAPVCAHCGCKIIGHGTADMLQMYCCSHCAKEAGILLKKKDV